VDLVAHRGNVGLVKEELGSVAPAIAVLGLLLREGQHVVGCIANSAQDGPVLETLIAMSRATIDLGIAGRLREMACDLQTRAAEQADDADAEMTSFPAPVRR